MDMRCRSDGKNLTHKWIMAWHDKSRVRGQLFERLKTIHHVLQVDDNGKGFSRHEVLVVMRGIRGKYHPPGCRSLSVVRVFRQADAFW